MFASTIHIEQVDEIFPALIETLNVMRNLFCAGELFVVRVDLIFHPAQVLNCFALAWVKQFNLRFTLLLAQLQQTLLLSSINQATINRTRRHCSQVQSFSS